MIHYGAVILVFVAQNWDWMAKVSGDSDCVEVEVTAAFAACDAAMKQMSKVLHNISVDALIV